MTSVADGRANGDRPEWVPVTRPIESFVEDVLAVRPGGTVRIFSGEANPVVYNDPRLLDALKIAKRERGATLLVTVGPALLTNGGIYSGLLLLAELGVVDALVARRVRGRGNHYRIVETDGYPRYYEEQHHSPLAPIEQRHCRDLTAVHPNEVEEIIAVTTAQFDSLLEEHAAAPGPPDRPLLATRFGLRHLTQLAEARGLDFDAVPAGQLRAWLEQATPPWTSVAATAEQYPKEWILFRIAAFDDQKRPQHGKVVAHSRDRSDIADAFDRELERATSRLDVAYYTFYSPTKSEA